MDQSMSLKRRMSCVVGVYNFGFEKYSQKLFDLMELKISPTLEILEIRNNKYEEKHVNNNKM